MDLLRRYADLVCRQSDAIACEDMVLFQELQNERSRIARTLQNYDLEALARESLHEAHDVLMNAAEVDASILKLMQSTRDYLGELLLDHTHTRGALLAYHASASHGTLDVTL
jgi:hypothetical protein